MRDSEGGTLKHTYSTFILETQRKADQERPSHPSIFSAGRAKPLDFTRLPDRFYYPINHHHPYYCGQGTYSFT